MPMQFFAFLVYFLKQVRVIVRGHRPDVRGMTHSVRTDKKNESAYEQLCEASHARGKKLIFIPLAYMYFP